MNVRINIDGVWYVQEHIQKVTEEKVEEPKEGFPVICSKCKVQTTVPFKPRKDWPVYCIDCFKEKQNGK